MKITHRADRRSYAPACGASFLRQLKLSAMAKHITCRRPGCKTPRKPRPVRRVHIVI